MYEEDHGKHGGLGTALLGAVIGGLIVAVIMLIVLFATGTIGRGSRTETVAGQKVVVDNVNVDSQVEAVAQVVPASVVGIETTSQEMTVMGPAESVGVGSGFIVTSDGYIVTNHHVVTDHPAAMSISLEDGSVYEGKKIWSDESLDLAVVKIDASGLPTVSLGDSDHLKVGEVAIAIGNPLGLQFERSVTSGIISALNRSLVVDNSMVAEDLIQTDATINQGNSGGPLLNGSGEVIGINTYKNAQGEGMGFAIPVNIIKPILNEIVAKGSFTPTVIGITGYDKQQAAYFVDTADFERGIYVASVQPGSGAASAGLRVGDVITSLDGVEVNTMLKMKEILYSHQPGDKIQVIYERDGKAAETEVEIQAKTF